MRAFAAEVAVVKLEATLEQLSFTRQNRVQLLQVLVVSVDRPHKFYELGVLLLKLGFHLANERILFESFARRFLQRFLKCA